MKLSFLDSLVKRWREDAKRLREYGAEGPAQACEKHAQALKDHVRQYQEEALPPNQAAEESGYTADHIRRLIRQGTLPNAGDASEPRVRRRHLPRKPGRHPGGDPLGDGVGSRTRVARTVVGSE